MDRIFNFLGSIVTIALVATVLQSRRTSDVLRSFGRAFRDAINAAQNISN